MNDDEPRDRRRTSARISRRIMVDLKPVPGLRLSADGRSLIKCYPHFWDWVTPTILRCRHCTWLKRADR